MIVHQKSVMRHHVSAAHTVRGLEPGGKVEVVTDVVHTKIQYTDNISKCTSESNQQRVSGLRLDRTIRTFHSAGGWDCVRKTRDVELTNLPSGLAQLLQAILRHDVSALHHHWRVLFC